MSTANCLVSAFFTAMPGMFLFILFLSSDWFGRDYWWGTYTAVLLVLFMTSLVFGFALPVMFQRSRMSRPWQWILLQGVLAWILSLAVLWLLNLTPLCIGQNNGDGNNDLGMCMFMTVMSGIVYTPIYLGLLAASAAIGHGVLSLMRPKART
jgi:hypothetical protein